MRLHQPVGIWLVLWPCIWSLLLAGDGHVPFSILLVVCIGAVLTRSAGCVVNDLADQDFDKHVTRTKTRPLANGELHSRQALKLLLALSLLSASLLFFLPIIAFYLALPAVLLIVAYPFMKRFTWWPQAFLGLTFNWGIFICWGVLRGTVELPAIWLYASAFFWTLGYDTIYGYQDLKDDEKIGVKSTSRRLQGKTRLFITGFYVASLACLWQAILSANPTLLPLWKLGVAVFALFLGWQSQKLDANDPKQCLRLFKANTWMGGMWLLPLLLGHPL